MNRIENYQIGHSSLKGDVFRIEQNISNNPNIEVFFSHRHTFYALYWIHEGQGIHFIDFKEYEIKPDRLFYVRPEQVHFLNSPSEIKYSALQFSEEFMLPYYPIIKDILTNENISPYKDLNGEEQQRLRILFDLIYHESTHNLPNSTAILQSGINMLMQELVRMDYQETVKPNLPDVLVKYRALINEQFLTYRQVKDYATQLGITPNYLNVLAQKHLGESALSLINNRIILETKRLLMSSKDDISVIAYQLKFNELSYFSRFFKRETGLTPNEFRAEMNKMYQ